MFEAATYSRVLDVDVGVEGMFCSRGTLRAPYHVQQCFCFEFFESIIRMYANAYACISKRCAARHFSSLTGWLLRERAGLPLSHAFLSLCALPFAFSFCSSYYRLLLPLLFLFWDVPGIALFHVLFLLVTTGWIISVTSKMLPARIKNEVSKFHRTD